jgi:hypothetical protein
LKKNKKGERIFVVSKPSRISSTIQHIPKNIHSNETLCHLPKDTEIPRMEYNLQNLKLPFSTSSLSLLISVNINGITKLMLCFD